MMVAATIMMTLMTKGSSSDLIGLFVRRSGGSWVGQGDLSVVRFPDPPYGDFQVSQGT